MHHPRQEFTFVDVNAGKKSNTRTIKRHVSNQTNRRKRQEAVSQYQKALLEAAEPTSSSAESSFASELSDTEHRGIVIRTKQSSSPEPFLSTHDTDDDYLESNFYQQLNERHPAEIVDYWPAYQEWAKRHIKSPPARQRNPGTRSVTRGVGKGWKVSLESSRVLVSLSNQHITLHIPRINAPAEFSRIQWALKTCSDFIHGTYESVWASEWQGRQWFEGSMLPLGIWRESFSLATEFIQLGKLKDAFFILNAAFDVTPAFFKQNHPGLLIALLGAMLYTCQISDEKLSKLIRSHITQLSMAHLGPKHPISICLREQLRAADAAHGRTDLLSIAVLDTFADVFGPSHFVHLSMRFGYVRRQLNSGQYDAALAAMDMVQKHWNTRMMPAAQLPKFLVFERAKVAQAKEYASKNNGKPLKGRTPELEKVADLSVKLPVFIPGRGPALAPVHSEILKKLGKYLLFGSHYALALFIYTRIPETLGSASSVEPYSNPEGDPEKLCHIVAKILLNHLKEEIATSAQGTDNQVKRSPAS